MPSLLWMYTVETFAKRPLLPNFCGPDERDLSTGSNFNPQNTQCIPVVKIFAFLELESRYSGKHFSKVSCRRPQSALFGFCHLLYIIRFAVIRFKFS